MVILCAAGLVVLYAAGGWLGARVLHRYAVDTASDRQARLESVAALSQAPSLSAGAPTGAKPVEVHVALIMNRVGDVALKESAWTADFNLALRWTGEGVSPGETFRAANGEILRRDKVDSYEHDGERYEEYHVVARLTKIFDPANFPFGDDVLLVELEDAAQGPEALLYVADESSSGLRTGKIMGHVKVLKTLTGVVYPRLETAPGGSDATHGSRATRSKFFFAILIAPTSLYVYVPMFLGLFASVAIAFIAFFIKPVHVDPRFGLPIGAFFAAVTNNISVASSLPPSDGLTLAQMVNAAGLITLFLILVESAVSLYIFDTLGRERLARFVDGVFFAALAIGFVGVNLLLPLAARPL